VQVTYLSKHGMTMKITSDLFHAYLKCPKKCWLRAANEPTTESDYPRWVKEQNQSYRTAEVARLVAASPTNEIAHLPDLKDVNRSPRNVWGPFTSEFKEFEKISVAAWWDYQRDRIWLRSKKRAEPSASTFSRRRWRP